MTQPSLNIKPISSEKLQAFWKRVIEDEYIPFGYIEDCCYAKAHRIAMIAKKMKIDIVKVWVRPRTGHPYPDLVPVDKNGHWIVRSGSTLRWGYHVAVIVLLEFDGVVMRRVIDPVFRSEGHMAEDTWLHRTGNGYPQYTSPSQYDRSGSEDPSGDVMWEDLLGHWLRFFEGPRLSAASASELVLDHVETFDPGPPAQLRTSSLGQLDLKEPSDRLISWLETYGVPGGRAVVMGLEAGSQAVIRMWPAASHVVDELIEEAEEVRIYTDCPTAYILKRNHHQFDPLLDLARRSKKDGVALLFVDDLDFVVVDLQPDAARTTDS